MDIKEIQDLIRFVAKSGVTEVELEKEGFKLVIKAERAVEQQVVTVPAVMPQTVQVAAAPAPVAAAPVPAAPVAESPKSSTHADEARYIAIKSPMIGTFYRTPGPDKDPFVKVGDEIQKGQVVCIIEAMKLFNEIESEISGKIVKILVDNASPVEYDQPLFLIDPA